LTECSLMANVELMGRPRGFDEAEVVRRAAGLFAVRSYDGISIDDLVAHLGVHRNSLYKTFGSKRGLYLAALGWSLEHEVGPLIRDLAESTEPGEALQRVLARSTTESALDLLIMAAAERAPVDVEVSDHISRTLRAFDLALYPEPLSISLTAVMLGLRLRARSEPNHTDIDAAGATLAHRLSHSE
jgi:TetR/AcrR family transcriptional regulator, transcriptional repressor for nem operon